MTNFTEDRFDDYKVHLEMQAGSQFSTTVVTVSSGYEQRQQNWVHPRGVYQVGMRNVSESEYETLKSFFMARRGMFEGFRLKDWTDYKAKQANGIIGTGVYKEDQLEYKLYKRYATPSSFYDRRIFKPREEYFVVYLNGNPRGLQPRPDLAGFYLDTVRGVITFNPKSQRIQNIINGSDTTIQMQEPHGLVSGSRIKINVVGYGLGFNNDTFYTVKDIVNATDFTIELDTRTANITSILTGINTRLITSNDHKYLVGEQIKVFGLYYTRNGVRTNTVGPFTITNVGPNFIDINLNSFVPDPQDPMMVYDLYAIDPNSYAIESNQPRRYITTFTPDLANKIFLFEPNNSSFTWSGEFDVPVRFDTDRFDHKLEMVVHKINQISNDDISYIKLGNIPCVEIKLKET